MGRELNVSEHHKPFDRRENEESRIRIRLDNQKPRDFSLLATRGRGTWVKKRFQVGQEGEE
jgi:hypothetical protein